jgi:tellurite resistance protein TehA-like permease
MPSKLGLVVRNYAPAWFVVSMGTGGLSIVLHQLPYQVRP